MFVRHIEDRLPDIQSFEDSTDVKEIAKRILSGTIDYTPPGDQGLYFEKQELRKIRLPSVLVLIEEL